MSIPSIVAKLIDLPGVVLYEHVGSRVTCNPPPVGTDDDWLVLTNSGGAFRSAVAALVDAGYPPGGSDISHEDGDGFYSLKSETDDVNVILTDDRKFFDRFLAASSVCQRLNLLDKGDRIAVFRAVLYAEECEPPEVERPI